MRNIKPVRECTGYVTRGGSRSWKAGCKWANKRMALQFSGLPKGTYTNDDPPHQCELCARKEAREQRAVRARAEA